MSKKNESNLNLIPVSEIRPASLDLDSVRRKLADAKGPKYWRTLEELSNVKAFGELLEREFRRQASEWVDPVSRRGFLKLAGASLALAGLAGCTKQPLEHILPYVRQPEDLIPCKPLFYATRQGSKAAFGGYYDPVYNFAAADVVVSLDADFLSGAWFPGFIRYARDWASRRKKADEQMSRLYVAESSPSTTGMKAEHRLPLRPSEVEKVARALAAKVGGGSGEQLTPEQQKWVDAAVKDLSQHRGKSLVVPGVFQSA